MAVADGEPCPFGEGLQAFWLRLTPPLSPPLAPIPGPAEIIVTGPATRVRVTVLP